MTAYYPREQLLFSSKLFSAHVAPPDAADPFDSAGQAAFVPHWRHFFDTTLAPVARQALEASKASRMGGGAVVSQVLCMQAGI